jgi:hypothetical protein
MELDTLLANAKAGCGFLSPEEVEELALLDPRRPCLIRCGGQRKLVPAALVTGTIRLIEADGDYVRDVSLPTSDPIWR